MNMNKAATNFNLTAHLLGHIAYFVFAATQLYYGGIIWGSIMAAVLYLIYRLAIMVFHGGASVVFFFLFIILTFSMSSFLRTGDKVGEWVMENQAIAKQATGQTWDYAPPKHGDLGNVAIEFEHDLQKVWSDSSYSRRLTYDDGIDTGKVFDDAWADFEKWVNDGANGTPPIPTPSSLHQRATANMAKYKFVPMSER